MRNEATRERITRVPHDVAVFHMVITTMLGERFSFEQLVDAICLCRFGRRIVIEHGTLDGATLGYCVDLRDCILIMIRRRLGATLDLSTRLHELGHVGLGHLAYVDLTRAEWHREWQINPDLRILVQQKVSCKSEVTAYTPPRECAAETIGTLWLQCITAHAAVIPESAQIMYGYPGSHG